MRRFISIATLALFTLWIIPLGVFIKPEQEKKACNGRRAICLCTHLLKKKMAKAAKTVFLKSGGMPQEQGGSPSFGREFTLKVKVYDFRLTQNKYSYSAPNIISTFFTRPIEHVPKA